MKKIIGFILPFFIFLAIPTLSNAQCTGVVTESFPLDPQTGSHNYFGVKVTLIRPYYQDINVEGYIFDEGESNTNHPFSLTVLAGDLTAQTSANFYETNPTATAVVNVTSVSACLSELGLDPYWQNELDSIGILHNLALTYAYTQLLQQDLSNLSSSTVLDLAATYTADFYTSRYGNIYNFNQNDLKSEILSIGINPLPIDSLDMSSQLKETVNSILSALTNLQESQSPNDFENMVISITNEAMNGLSIDEKTYLTAYKNLITKSFSYWDQNISDWAGLSGNMAFAMQYSGLEKNQAVSEDNLNYFGENKFKIGLLTNNETMFSIPYLESKILKEIPQRHPCAVAIASADGGGLFAGLVRGCIVGALFGAGVGCIPAAIFWGGVQGVSSSIGAGITCLLMQ